MKRAQVVEHIRNQYIAKLHTSMSDEIRITAKFFDIEDSLLLKEKFTDLMFKINKRQKLNDSDIEAVTLLLKNEAPKYQHFQQHVRNIFNENA